MFDKVAAVGRKLTALRAVGQQAQVREALTRAELTVALTEALAGRAELDARLRSDAALRLRHAWPRSDRRHNRVSKRLDRALARLGAFGQALVVARSGTWTGTGRILFDLRHMAAYARRRANPNVAPFALVDQRWYLATYPDVAAGKTAPLVHYLISGAADGRSPHPLFDAPWYARRNAAELAATGLTPLEHFVRHGASDGHGPHPLFDVVHYAAQAGDLQPPENPLQHYLRAGWGRGLSPHPLFDPHWYVAQAPQAAAEPPLIHYLREGWRAGLTPHPLFDPAWYLDQHPDVAATGDEPLSHFVAAGGTEGRNPSPWFDSAHYAAVRGLPPGVNPLVDYLTGGAWAVSEARPGFPTAAYLAAEPQLVRAGLTPLEHWARRREG
jgi:hypothetical protein